MENERALYLKSEPSWSLGTWGGHEGGAVCSVELWAPEGKCPHGCLSKSRSLVLREMESQVSLEGAKVYILVFFFFFLRLPTSGGQRD